MLTKLRAIKYSDWNSYRCGSLISTIYLASTQPDTTLVIQNSLFSDRHIAIVLFSIVSQSFTLLILDKFPVVNNPDVAELSNFYEKLRLTGEPSSLANVLVSKLSVPLVLLDFITKGSIDMLLVVDSLGFCFIWQFNNQTSAWSIVYNFSVITTGISDSIERKQVARASYCFSTNILVWQENCSVLTDNSSINQSSVKFCYLAFGTSDPSRSLNDPRAFEVPPSISQPITVLILDSIHGFQLRSDGQGIWIIEGDGSIFHYDFNLCQILSTVGCSVRQSGAGPFKTALFASRNEDVKSSNTLYVMGDNGEVCTVINCRNYLKVINQVLPPDLLQQLVLRAGKVNHSALSSSSSINLQDFSVVCEDCSLSAGVVKVNTAYFALSASGRCYLLKHSHLPLHIDPDDLFSSDFWQHSNNGQPAVNYKAMSMIEDQVNHTLYREISLPSGGKNKKGPFLGGHSFLSVDSQLSRLTLSPLLVPDLTNRILFDDQNVAPDDESSGFGAVLLLLRSPSSLLQLNCQFLVNAKSSQFKSQGLLSLQQHQLWDLIINPNQAEHGLPSTEDALFTEEVSDAVSPLAENINILNVPMDKAFASAVVPAPDPGETNSKEGLDENTDVLGEVPLSFKGNPWGSVRFAEEEEKKNPRLWSPSRLVNSRMNASKAPTNAFSLQGMAVTSSESVRSSYGAPHLSVLLDSAKGGGVEPSTQSAVSSLDHQSGSKGEAERTPPSQQYSEYLLQRMVNEELSEVYASDALLSASPLSAELNVDNLIQESLKEFEDRLRTINISAVMRDKARKSSASAATSSSASDAAVHRARLEAMEEQRNQELNRLIEKYLDEGVHPAVITVNDPKKRLRTTDAMLTSACYQVHWDDIKSFFNLHQSSIGEDESHLLRDINNTPLHWMDCLDIVSLSPANSILHSDYPPDNDVNIYQVVDPFKLLEIVSTLNPARRSLYRPQPSAHLIDFTSPCYAVEQMVRQLLFSHPAEMFAVLLHLRRVEREFKTSYDANQAIKSRRERDRAAALSTQSPNVSLMDTDGYYSTFYGSLFREVNEETTGAAAAPRLSLPSETSASSALPSAISNTLKTGAVGNPEESDNEEEGEEYSFFKTVGGSDSEDDMIHKLDTINENEEDHESDEEAEHHRLVTPLIPLKQVASDIDVLGALSEAEVQQLMSQKEKRIARFSGMHSAMSSAESSPVRSYEQAAVGSLLAEGQQAITDELLEDAIARDRNSFAFPGFEDEVIREEAQLSDDDNEDESDSEEYSFFRTVGTDSDSLLDGTDMEDEEVDGDGVLEGGYYGGGLNDGREYVSLVDRVHTVSAAVVFLNTKPLQNWDILSHYAGLTATQQDCLLKTLLLCGDTTLAVEAMFSWNRLYLLTLYMIRLSASANYVAQHISMNAHTEQGLFQPNGITRNVNQDESDIFADEYYHTGRGRLNRPESFPVHLSPVSPFVAAKTPDWNKVGNGWDIEFEEHLDAEGRILLQQPGPESEKEKELSFAERRMLEAVQLFKRVFLFCLQRNSLECAREIVRYKPKWVQDKVIVTLFRLFASSQYAATSPMVKDESTLQKILSKK